MTTKTKKTKAVEKPKKASQAKNGPQRSIFFSLRWKLLVGFTLLFSIVFALAFYWFFSFATQQALSRIQADLLDVLNGGSGLIDGDLLLSVARDGQPNAAGEAWLAVAIILFGTLLAIATGLLLSRFVVRPMAYLHQGVIRLAAQDFRASIPIESDDELGELAQAFNTMASSLREARDQQQREFQRDKLTALGELSLAMAHEIRNPIGIINTASRLLETTEDKAKQSELRRAIHEESLRLDRLLNDFQQLARHHRPQFVAIDPAAPLEKALQVMLTGQDNISIVRRFSHAALRVQADADLLYQAWVNLIRNALDAMGPQGGQLEVGSVMEANAVLLYLQDCGPGIPLEHMTRLFEPFYTTKEQGSGLGLTIANTLAEATGAQLELVPGSWRGARFAMRFIITPTESN